VATLAGTPYDTGLDLKKLDKITKYFTPLREKYLKDGLMDPKVLKVDVNALLYQVPGGMLSNLVSQLKAAGKSELLQEVLEEVPRVRADAGYVPLVTPTSQIVGTQAVFNVLTGERYKQVTKEFRGVIHGDYGKTPSPIDPEFSKTILKGEEPITCRPADLIAPELDTLREKVKLYQEQEEDVLSFALFEQVATKFFEKRRAEKYGIDAAGCDPEGKTHIV
jgi:oxaloacetate decarboxylase alpha subunit